MAIIATTTIRIPVPASNDAIYQIPAFGNHPEIVAMDSEDDSVGLI